MKTRLITAAFHRLATWASNRPPSFVIGDPADPYLRRWHVIPRNPLLNVYLHHVRKSDEDRALHCHPWASVSVILNGQYIERLPARQSQDPALDYRPGCTRDVLRPTGSITFRRSGRHRHRLIIAPGGRPCWTLFVTGPAYRSWGFWCARGWVHWRHFVSDTNRGVTGRGCG